jgi:aspartyl-tRNA(Asn)/glutamyl-tRNA(Gln) amidotransferase subunit B
MDKGIKRIGITRVHMEEDAGKLIHDAVKPFSYIDFNRSGTPLLEIVSEPDITTPDEAYFYLNALKVIIEYLGVSDCNMEEGSLRCDANISVRPREEKSLGSKVEIKNMNSFKGVRLALEYEEKRQRALLSSGKKVMQETRLWNADKKTTEPMRSKEEAHDYRYFPEPDLVPFKIESALVEEIRKDIPELPQEKLKRFTAQYGLGEYDVSTLVSDKTTADFFECCAKLYKNPKNIANWLMGDIAKYMNAKGVRFSDLKISPETLTGMLELIDNSTISGKMAKELLDEMLATGKPAADIIKAKGLAQIKDRRVIENFIEEVIAENSEVVNDYLVGKQKAFMFLIGALMKKTKGKVNPYLANEILKERLRRQKR